MDDSYRIADTPPPIEDYLRLRAESGLSPKNVAQANAALRGGWASRHVVHEPTGEIVGMGRVIGDGGWYFHVIDMAVLPGHQRRGIGDVVLGSLLDQILADAPPGAYVNLLADHAGRRLYERHGFVETSPGCVGMALRSNGGRPVEDDDAS